MSSVLRLKRIEYLRGASEVNDFGHVDWLIPRERELGLRARLFSVDGPGLANILLGEDFGNLAVDRKSGRVVGVEL